MKREIFSILVIFSLISLPSLGDLKIPTTSEQIKAFCSDKDYEKKIKEIKPKEIQQEIAHKCFMTSNFEKSKPKTW